MKTVNKVVLARLAYFAVRGGRTLLGRNDHIVVTRGGLKYELDLSQAIDLSIYILGEFERRTKRALRRYLRPGMTVLDIGANIGAHTLGLARSVQPGGRVLAFEPTDYAFRKLLRNIRLNPCLNETIDCFQYFLTSYSKVAAPKMIYSSWPLNGGGDLHAAHRGESMSTAGAKAAPLDSVLADLAIGKVDLIKLDVDGFERDVLAGATEMLRRDRPIFAVELAPYVYGEGEKSFESFVEMFNALGYRFYDQRTGKRLPQRAADIEAEIRPGSGKNAIAHVSSW